MPRPKPGALPPGTPVRINERSPWPERVGLTGVVVAPPADGTYPQPSPVEVVVFLPDDPFHRSAPRGWSCVMYRTGVDLVSS